MDIILFFCIGLIVAYLYTPLGDVIRGIFNMEQLAHSSVYMKDIKSLVPEDSVLKRHFLANLKSEVEEGLFPRPTCSTLKRHYDSLVAVEIESRLYK